MSLRLPVHLLARKRSFVIGGGVVIMALGAVVGLTLIPSTGAYFFDAKDGYFVARTGTLGLQVSTARNLNPDGSFNIVFDALYPGSTGATRFTATNTGTMAGRLRLSTKDFSVIGGQNPDMGYLSVAIAGYGNIPIQSNGTEIDLGTLQVGETRDFDVLYSLSPSAGNEWQGVQITDTFTLGLSQLNR